MTLLEAQQRALEIREKYDQLSIRNNGSSWTRADLMQGFVGDVGDLAKLVMAMDGKRHIDDAAAKIAHEISDCLWSVLVLAHKFDIDIEAEFKKNMQDLDTRVSGELAR
jgi:NTP pyrophosphatase (non-canonical NTP hydrolase)